MKRNITLSYVLTYLYHSWFWLGTWVFYYLRFTDYKGIGIIESIMIVLSIVFEIPTGVISDKIGKKNSLFISFLLCGIGNMLFGFSTSFLTLIFSMSTFCLGAAFYSGTFEALQFDSLKSIGEEDKFKDVASKTNTYSLIAFAVSSIIGGYLYKIFPGLPFVLVGVMNFISAGLTMFLIEPKIDSEKGGSFNTFYNDLLIGFKQLTSSANLKRISLILCGVGMVVVVCSQALNDLLGYEFGFSPTYFGIIAAVMYLLSSIASSNSSRLSDYFGEWNLVLITSVLVGITLLFSPWLGLVTGTIVLSLRWIFQSIFDVTSSVVINHNIDSDFRATTLSTFSFVKNIPYAFTAVVLGNAMDGLGARNFAFYLGLVLCIFLVGSYFLLNTKEHIE